VPGGGAASVDVAHPLTALGAAQMCSRSFFGGGWRYSPVDVGTATSARNAHSFEHEKRSAKAVRPRQVHRHEVTYPQTRCLLPPASALVRTPKRVWRTASAGNATTAGAMAFVSDGYAAVRLRWLRRASTGNA
jgi:hypothetical protein